MGKQEKRGLQALIGGWDRLLPKPVCCALVVRVVKVVEWWYVYVACQMGYVWVVKLKVGMMGDTDCACEEA
jgi:hypothetical protein